MQQRVDRRLLLAGQVELVLGVAVVLFAPLLEKRQAGLGVARRNRFDDHLAPLHEGPLELFDQVAFFRITAAPEPGQVVNPVYVVVIGRLGIDGKKTGNGFISKMVQIGLRYEPVALVTGALGHRGQFLGRKHALR